MGKQAGIRRTALANAGAAKEATPVVAPPEKVPVREPAPTPKRRSKEKEPEPEQKTKKQTEEEQRELAQENARQRAEFYELEAAKKLRECRGIDESVTYVEDKDTRKPKAISDISEYWKVELGMLPFMPNDNLGPNVEMSPDSDIAEHREYLQMFNEQLQKLLRMKFHVFWSQVLFDPKLRRCLDSYLRFCLRNHDSAVSPVQGEEITDQDVAVLDELAQSISRRVLATFTRMSRPRETSHDFISTQKFGELLYEHTVFDIPKLIDICAIYGDSNRATVTRLVHSVFTHQPRYRDDFKAVVQHMLGGLHQCCHPLKNGGRKNNAELSVEECMSFLPDILSCFNAIFCFFPEDCVELLLEGKVGIESSSRGAASQTTSLPWLDLMVTVYDALASLEKPTRGGMPPESMKLAISTIRPMLCRLLSLVLGFHMGPRRGAAAFQELLTWCTEQSELRSALLGDLALYGLENVMLEWLASGLADRAQMDFVEQLCGRQLLPADRRASAKAAAKSSSGSAAGSAGVAAAPSAGAGSSSSSVKAPPASGHSGKIREVREVVGTDFGEGFVLQCLLHFHGSVPNVVDAILDGNLPAQLDCLPRKLALTDDPTAATTVSHERAKISSDDKRHIIDQVSRLEKEALEESYANEGEDFDDTYEMNARVGPNESASEKSEEEDSGQSSDDGAQRSGGKGGGYGGKGGGKGGWKGRGPVQGQTIQARRKEENKAKFANHNRKAASQWKMSRGM
eukprot:gnl/TRDRNA2_/TRDRNA2_160582_c0_seq1.p1 gnl/TRDRNA2_/TRDRNA2_160582_c0~~gnl/TRDRNA2_/TRDRNA2_160582_c0_seq1.p1  ORF type:complete len:740 (+),score=132.38 gnl/TRDRNA2_/TRDRNA2_160582_c0_seq1:97-2316(+)